MRRGAIVRSLAAAAVMLACAPRPPAATGNAPPAAPSALANPCPADSAAAGRPAAATFATPLQSHDLRWLCAEGFRVTEIFEATGVVRLRIPPGYAGDPLRNPRVRRFDVQMRG